MADSFPQIVAVDATPEEAAEWVRDLVRFVGPGFHPDSQFEDYVLDDGSPCYSAADCELLEAALARAWSILDKADIEIYAVALPIQRRLLGAED